MTVEKHSRIDGLSGDPSCNVYLGASRREMSLYFGQINLCFVLFFRRILDPVTVSLFYMEINT